MRGSITRIIDANMNRISEGLRVIEELFRFYLNDAEKTEFIKHIRHNITKILKNLYSNIDLYISRDIVDDVGVNIKSEDELVRSGIEEIFLTNAGRVKESLRVVEEYLKLISPEDASKIEKLRYSFYGFEKKVAVILKRKESEFYGSRIGYVISQNDNIEKAIKHIDSNDISIVKVEPFEDEEKTVSNIKKLKNNYHGFIYIEDDIKIGLLTHISGILLRSSLASKELIINMGNYFLFGGVSLNSQYGQIEFLELELNKILELQDTIKKLKKTHSRIRIISKFDEDNNEIQMQYFKDNIIDILLFGEKNLTKNENIIKITKEYI